MKKLFYLLSLLLAALLVSCSSAETDNKDADDVKEPSTSDRINPANGHAYVDLGLSVKWATCNVGANAPEEYGDYFAWGETKPKDCYDWSTYKWCNGSNTTLTKYCTDSDYGTVDNKTVLDLADDAAHANWGGAWRMPTKEEQQELQNNCTWTWTTQNGVDGYTVKSKINGKSIFLPLAGECSGFAQSPFDFGRYWSSSVETDYWFGAYFLQMVPEERGNELSNIDYGVSCTFNKPIYGCSVRPVLP